MRPTLTQLGETCEFIKDGSHGSPERTAIGIPVLSAEHVQDGRLSFSTGRFTSQRELDVFQKRLRPRPGDVLLTIVGTIGRTAILRDTRPFVFQRSVCVLRPRAGILDSDYLRYALSSDFVVRQIEKETKQVAQAGIYLDSINGIELPLPDLAEQQRIARLLDRADRLRRTRRSALELNDAFLPAAFVDLFGDPRENPRKWPNQYLSDVCLRFSDGPFGSNLKSEHYRPSGVRVIRLSNIGIGEFLNGNQAFISAKHFGTLRKHECLPGDVLIGTLGDPNLRACIQPAEIKVALNKADCVQARTNPENVNAEYLCGLLNMPSTLNLVPGMVHGQTRARVSMGELAELPIPIPPLPMQQHFSSLVERHERMRARQREALRQAGHLFQTLLHKAFYRSE